MAERIDLLAILRAEIERAGGDAYPVGRALIAARDAVEDLIDFLRDAECNCRPATEQYEAHTCRRCELLARVGGAE